MISHVMFPIVSIIIQKQVLILGVEKKVCIRVFLYPKYPHNRETYYATVIKYKLNFLTILVVKYNSEYHPTEIILSSTK